MKDILNYLFEKNYLDHNTAKSALKEIAEGKHSEAELAAFLTIFLMRPIQPQEMLGFRDAMLDLCVPVNLSEYDTIDVCGTGGDEKNTFNISTLAALVLAGAGIKVVKHGNYGVSSACGSSNIFEYYGYKFSNQQDKISRELEQCNMCYLHAPIFHPAMKNIAPVRKALKVKTFFNVLGPMVNPCRPKNQVVGVYNEEALKLYQSVYKLTDINYCILHSVDGYDEISLTGDFKYTTNDTIKTVSPKEFGFDLTNPEALFGGNTVEEAVSIFKNILDGEGTKAQNDVVVMNAAMALNCLDKNKSFVDCAAQARESLLGRKAFDMFQKLINMQA